MKLKLLALTLFTAVNLASAQEAIPQEDLQKATRLLSEATEKQEGLPLKADLDWDKAQGIKAESAGLIVVPDKNLATATSGDKKEMRKQGKQLKKSGGAIPVGQLWTLNIAPKVDGAVVPNDKLRLVNITTKDKEMQVALFTLGLEIAGKKELKLVVYGKDKTPLLTVPLNQSKGDASSPLTVSARRDNDDTGTVTLSVAGKLKGEFTIGKQGG